ncbi:MAG: hypothetical protein ACRD2R_01440 [Terriglobales bacterium]
MSGNSKARARLRMACEIAADRVLAARAEEDGRAIHIYASRALPPGVVSPGLAAANVADPAALREAVASALGAVAGRSRDVIAVLPDAAVRVALLDFDAFPEKHAEAAALVRHRLKKTLPFDVERAAVSFHAQRGAAGVRVVAAVAPQSIVEEYESAIRDTGYNPGVVLPSTLAALGAVEAARPTMVVKVDATTAAVAIVDGDELRLFRIVSNRSGGRVVGSQLAEEIYPSVVFFQDTYGATLERVLVGGQAPLENVGPALEAQTGVPVGELVGARFLGGNLAGDAAHPSTLAGVVGALVA